MLLDNLLDDRPPAQPPSERERRAKIHQTLLSKGANVLVLSEQQGPSTRTYVIEPRSTTTVRKIKSCMEDVAVAMGTPSVCLMNVDGVLQLEVPRLDRYYPKTLEENKRSFLKGDLNFVMGIGSQGEIITANLGELPHLLIAGATGSGKSVALHNLICGLVSTHSPADLRLILVDPKQLELTAYEGLPHLASEVVTSANEALLVVQELSQVMESRYETLAASGHRSAIEAGMSKIVLIIDEFADFRLDLGRDFEIELLRLAQKARAAGIHLVLATQRPSVKVVTGDIKANFPARLALKTASAVDSRVILGDSGAQSLLGKGDALFLHNAKIRRLQVPFAGREDIERLKGYYEEQAQQSCDPDRAEVEGGSERVETST